MNEDIKQLLIKYIAKETSIKESAWVKSWISFSDENELAFIKLYENYHASLANHHQFVDTENAYRRFMKEQVQPSKIKMNRWMAYAALFLTICSIGIFFTTYQSSTQEGWKTILVGNGKKIKIILPDGTKVGMNAGSTLKYNKGFGRQQRQVFLDGEAYFDIAKSKNNIPFIIDAAGYIIRDIGTVFKIKAYSEDGDFESYVVNGEISVEKKTEKSNKIYLTKNQALKIPKQIPIANEKEKPYLKKLDPKIKITNLNKSEKHIETYEDWTNGTLIFDNTSFEQIINTLERQYNLNIEIKDESLKNYYYSGNFEHIANVYKILDIIKQNTPFTYTTSGKTIIIDKLTKL